MIDQTNIPELPFLKEKKKVLFILLIPFIVMASITLLRAYRFHVGQKIILKVEGYDPRDLLSGHYVIYRVIYPNANICYSQTSQLAKAGYVCLDDIQKTSFTYTRPLECQNVLKGACRGGRFKAGIERFYIPEANAKKLDKMLRANRGSIEISLTGDAKAQVKELLIDGKPWQSKIK